MKFIDIFAGIGGFRKGLELAGHECIGYIEKDKYARRSYQAIHNTENEWNAEDISDLKPGDIPKADLWAFGFPCQDISVSGKQEGLSGKKSGLFYTVIELIKGKNTEDKPQWLLIENVKNLLSVNGGRDFTTVLSEISEAGYDAEWHLVNSKDYGVPQNRERVYIIAHLRKGRPKQILPITGTSEQASGEAQKKQQEVNEKFGEKFKHLIGNRKYQNSHVYATDGVSRACDTNQRIYYAIDKDSEGKINVVLDGSQGDRIYSSNGLSKTLTGVTGGVGGKSGLYTVEKNDNKIQTVLKGDHQTDTVVNSDGISTTLKATDYKSPKKVTVEKNDNNIKPILNPGKTRREVLSTEGITSALLATDYKGARKVAVPCITPGRIKKSQNGRRFKEPEEPMYTLTTQDIHGVLIYDGKEYYIRKLTPRECFRLQGFSDEDFDKVREINSDTQLYKQAGNAVTVNVVKYFGEILKKIEDKIND